MQYISYLKSRDNNSDIETNTRSNTCNIYICVCKVTYACKDDYILLYVCSYRCVTYTPYMHGILTTHYKPDGVVLHAYLYVLDGILPHPYKYVIYNRYILYLLG